MRISVASPKATTWVFAALSLLSSVAFARQTIFQSVSRGEKIYTIFYQENQSHFRDRFVVHNDGYQDRISHELLSQKDWTEEKSRESGMQNFAKTSHDLKSQVRDQVIWPVTNQWDMSWEQKFGDWIDNEVDAQFMQRYQLSTDCADAMLTFRWIFARINGLPAANSLAGSGNLLTNESMRKEWENLPTAATWDQDQRFRAALDYLLENAYTHTLEADSYPILIDRQYFLSGTVHLDIMGESGHTMIVHHVAKSDKEIPFRVYWSTVPKTVRELTDVLYTGSAPLNKQGGFMRLRWPVKANGSWQLTARGSGVGFSEEQYDPNFSGNEPNFAMAVYRKLFPNFDVKLLMQGLVDTLITQIKSRVDVVNEGFAFCQKNPCAPGTKGYEDWSTPSRDAGLRGIFKAIHSVMAIDYTQSSVLINIWQTASKTVIAKVNGIDLTPQAVEFALHEQFTSVVPTDSIDDRWGIAPKSVFAKISAPVEAALHAREDKINNVSALCSTAGTLDCEFYSSNWLANDTQYEDFAIQFRATLPQLYCLHFPSLCHELTSQMDAEIVSLKRGTKSLSQWLSDSVWFMSDPRLAPDRRWTGFPEKVIWTDLSEACFVEGMGNLRALVTDCKGGRRVIQADPQSHRAKNVGPAIDATAILSENGNFLYYYDSAGQPSLFNFLDQASKGVAKLDVANCHEFNNKSFSCHSRSNEFALYDFSNGNVLLSFQFTSADYASSLDEGWVVGQDGNSTRFISWDPSFHITQDIRLPGKLRIVVGRGFAIDEVPYLVKNQHLDKITLAPNQKSIVIFDDYIAYRDGDQMCLRIFSSHAKPVCIDLLSHATVLQNNSGPLMGTRYGRMDDMNNFIVEAVNFAKSGLPIFQTSMTDDHFANFWGTTGISFSDPAGNSQWINF